MSQYCCGLNYILEKETVVLRTADDCPVTLELNEVNDNGLEVGPSL